MRPAVLTIFFCDIESYTSLSEKLELSSLQVLLEDYLTEISFAIEQTSGTIDKFIGDAVMVCLAEQNKSFLASSRTQHQ